jgi:hypothetical protein
MNEFYTKQDTKLRLQIVEKGVLFIYPSSSGSHGEILQVGQTWASIHTLVARLRNGQSYSARDQSLFISKQGEELHMKFQAAHLQLVEVCIFSGEETRRILTMLEKLPSMN